MRIFMHMWKIVVCITAMMMGYAIVWNYIVEDPIALGHILVASGIAGVVSGFLTRIFDSRPNEEILNSPIKSALSGAYANLSFYGAYCLIHAEAQSSMQLAVGVTAFVLVGTFAGFAYDYLRWNQRNGIL